MTEIVTKAATEGEDALSRSEKKALQGSREGSRVLDELKYDTDLRKKTQQDVKARTEEYKKAAETAAPVSEKQKKPELPPKVRVDVESVNSQMATEDEQNNAEGEKPEGRDAVVVGGKWGRLTGAVNDETGTRILPKFTVEVDGKTETVDASDLGPTDFATAAVVRAAAVNKGTYSVRFTNLLLEEARNNRENVGVLLRDAERIRMYAYLGMKAPKTELSAETAEKIWLDSTEEMAEQQKKAHAADHYIMSANAISENGMMLNIDGNGNRIAALANGPKVVYILVGENKFVGTEEDALERCRKKACPENSRRLNRMTPCAGAGYCSDCSSPGRICNNAMWTWHVPQGREYHICVAPGELGL